MLKPLIGALSLLVLLASPTTVQAQTQEEITMSKAIESGYASVE